MSMHISVQAYADAYIYVSILKFSFEASGRSEFLGFFHLQPRKHRYLRYFVPASLRNTVIYNTSCLPASKTPLQPCSAPPVRSKSLLQARSVPPVRSKTLLRASWAPPVAGNACFEPARRHLCARKRCYGPARWRLCIRNALMSLLSATCALNITATRLLGSTWAR